MSNDVFAQSLLGRSFDTSAHLAELADVQAGLLKFLVNAAALGILAHAEGIRRVLVLRLRNWDLIRITGARLIEQVQSVLVSALVTAWHHYGLHVVRCAVVHEGHLLRVNRFLLVDLARLDCDTLGLHVHRAAGTLVAHASVLGLTLTALGRLLLGEAHILRLHHIRGHT